VGQCVTRALTHLFVLVGGETAAAEDSAIVVDAFNAMVDGWFADGLAPVDDETLVEASRTALVEGVVYITSDALPVLDRHFEGLAAMLAVSCADDFDAQLKPSVVRLAQMGSQRIDAAFMPSMVASVDRALKRLPSSHYWPAG
jgi:hypothetical protein